MIFIWQNFKQVVNEITNEPDPETQHKHQRTEFQISAAG